MAMVNFASQVNGEWWIGESRAKN